MLKLFYRAVTNSHLRCFVPLSANRFVAILTSSITVTAINWVICGEEPKPLSCDLNANEICGDQSFWSKFLLMRVAFPDILTDSVGMHLSSSSIAQPYLMHTCLLNRPAVRQDWPLLIRDRNMHGFIGLLIKCPKCVKNNCLQTAFLL